MITGAKTFLNEGGFKTTINLVRYSENDVFTVHKYVYDSGNYEKTYADYQQRIGEEKNRAMQEAEAERTRKNQENNAKAREVNQEKIKLFDIPTQIKERATENKEQSEILVERNQNKTVSDVATKVFKGD
jgi:hypothetical protein